jgi:hypothetical protein
LKTNSQGRYVHNTTLYGEKGCYVELDLTLWRYNLNKKKTLFWPFCPYITTNVTK